MEQATKKQIKFIKDICETLFLTIPQNLSKQEASKFISNNIEEYNNAIKKQNEKDNDIPFRMNEPTFDDYATIYPFDED